MTIRRSAILLLVGGLGLLSARPAVGHATASSLGDRVADDSTKASTSGPSRLPASWNRVSLWVGGTSLNGRLIGKIPRSSLAMLGVRYHHRLAPHPETQRTSGLTYTYIIDLLPLVAVSIPSGTVPKTSLSDRTVFTDGITTYGVGIAPIGLRINYRVDAPVEPYIAGSTGALFFHRSLPDGRGERVNFMVDAGAGLQISLTSRTILSVGYRYHHLSNGFRGEINPGIDSHLFHAGVTIVP